MQVGNIKLIKLINFNINFNLSAKENNIKLKHIIIIKEYFNCNLIFNQAHLMKFDCPSLYLVSKIKGWQYAKKW